MSTESYATHPNLEKRFLQPPGWRWHMFAGHNGEKLRFGTAFPKHTIPKAVVVILPGLAEYCEKYFEIANDLLNKKYAVYIMEWQGQGRSFRHIKKNPHKRISNGFSNDVKDLDIFIRDYIIPSAVHPEVGRLPLAMLAHSMGGNIGLRYLKDNPKTFGCAAMTAPMFGIKAFKIIPPFMRVALAKILYEIGDHSYVPGARNYEPRTARKVKAIHSTDPVRNDIHDTWMEFDPNLQCGGVTYKWLYYAARTCSRIRKHSFLRSIHTPLLFATAGKEQLVSNSSIRHANKILPNANIVHFPDAGHEIMMETDTIRNEFLKSFDELIKINILYKKESTKPF